MQVRMIHMTTEVSSAGLERIPQAWAGVPMGRGVGEDGIGCNRFIPATHIKGRVRRLTMLLEDGSVRHPGMLGSVLEGLLDGLGIHPSKQRT
jgi:hypothetical protein